MRLSVQLNYRLRKIHSFAAASVAMCTDTQLPFPVIKDKACPSLRRQASCKILPTAGAEAIRGLLDLLSRAFDKLWPHFCALILLALLLCIMGSGKPATEIK